MWVKSKNSAISKNLKFCLLGLVDTKATGHVDTGI